LELPTEWVEHETQRFERHGTEERFILAFAEDDWRSCTPSFQLKSTFADAARECPPVRQHEVELALGLKA